MSSLQGSGISTMPVDLKSFKDMNNGKSAGVDGGRKGDHQIERIKKLFQNAELSASAYDTAWVAMVRSPAGPKAPIFPGCLNWVLENQHKDGSWGDSQPGLVKDALSSTLACVLALKRWGVGEQHVHTALEFMERHSGSVMDSSQHTPVGFDVIFPAMVQTCALDFDLNLPLRAADVELMMRRRELELNNSAFRSKGRAAYLAYIAEGLGDDSPADHWETAMKFKRKNGSLFDSPSATAAAYLHRQDADSLGYLRALVDDIAGPNTAAAVAVPAIYPNEIQAQLCLIDAIEGLGVERHFRQEMKAALDNIYIWWRRQQQQGEEEAVLDIKTCAMAFRLLRLNGYPVASDRVLGRFITEDIFRDDTLEGYLKDEEAVMELLKASEVRYSNESILEHQQVWTRQYLSRLHCEGNQSSQTQRQSSVENPIATQLRDMFDFPFHVDLNRLSTRRKIEQYRTDNSRTSKSSFSCPNYGSEDLLKLAVEDFNLCQSFHQQELKQVMSWLEEYKLDEKRSAKLKMGYSYFSAAANLFEPHLSHARISFAKQSHLTGLIDEFYDEFGTQEEQLNLLDLLERWDVSGPQAKFCSEEVETLYWALHSAICETVDNAFAYQGRSVMDHVVQLWVDALRSMVKESDWSRTRTVPAVDEYMRNATTSFALGPSAVTTLYLLGPALSDEVARGPEIRNLYRVMSVTGRLLNDCVGFEREAREGKLNAVPLLMRRDDRTAEEVVREIRRGIDNQTRELFRLVLEDENYGGSTVPKESKKLFWMMTKLVHLVYQKDDGYNSTNLARVAESVIKEPISLKPHMHRRSAPN